MLDDLQWADAASFDLLIHIAARVRSAGLLLIGAFREGEAVENQALLHAVAELNRRRQSVTLDLGSLEAAESRELVRDLLGGELAPDVADLLHDHSEGNPFFLEELVRALIENRALIQQGEQWELGQQPTSLLPPRVVEAVRMRLARLDPALLDLLRVAAVAGRSCNARHLAPAAGMDPEQAEEMLLAAVGAHLVRLDADGVYTFTHDMVREALYAEVGRERRRRLHQAIGEALAADEDRGTHHRLTDLAFHFAQSGDQARGVAYALAAGWEALQASAGSEAAGHFRTAIHLMRDSDLDERASALMGLGAAATLVGDYPQAGESYEAAREEFQQNGDVVAAAKASEQLGQVRRRQEDAAGARQAFEHVLELLGPTDSPAAADALLQLADLRVTNLGEHAEGTADAARALAMIERLGDRTLEARALCVVGNIRARSNDPTGGRAALERSLTLAQEVDDPALAAEACAYLANVSGWTGDIARSRELSLQRLALAERTHDPFELRHVYSWIGGLDAIQGRWPEAERWFAQQEEALEGLPTPEPLATLRGYQGLLHFYRGRFEGAEQALREAVALVRPMGPGQLVWYLGRLSLTLAELRAREEALGCLTELQALTERVDERSSARLCAFAYLAVGYVRLDERQRAAACYTSLLPFRGQFAHLPADRALGLAAAAAGDLVSARRHLADAEEQTREAGMRPELALILLERGLLDREPLTGAAERPKQSAGAPNGPIAEGLRLCAELGMQELGSRILDPEEAKPRIHVAGLTDREVEVLRLVADGRSNREIARILFLSEHTVARHLTHIFTKTGVDNRAGAVAYALRHHIV